MLSLGVPYEIFDSRMHLDHGACQNRAAQLTRPALRTLPSHLRRRTRRHLVRRQERTGSAVVQFASAGSVAGWPAGTGASAAVAGALAACCCFFLPKIESRFFTALETCRSACFAEFALVFAAVWVLSAGEQGWV